MPTREDLKYLQAMPLDLKVAMTKARVREAVHRYGEDRCHISFSGGKDSTVLLDIVRSVYPNIEAVFVNTRLGLRHVFDTLNSIYGDDFIKYE
ncbi:MAG: phosphoadenosine phosphosulfate reductase family protein [Ruminococcus sp.]|nr:phosphoadenosine phosphosulfate reductase family protein [Ruminococcus sp.]